MFVELRRYGKARKFVAEVEAVGHECDLALLSVDDDEFFDGVTPLRVGSLPHLGERVKVCGYPVGGDRLSITQGIVSRIDLVRYAQSQRKLLAVQVDAAINSGNSGGPVLRGNQLVGIAFQTLDDAASVGYMIASSVIEHFLEDVAGGHYDGFPGLGIQFQELESRAHRRALGLPFNGRGVLVTRVAYDSSAWGMIREGDVLLSVGGYSISESGTVGLRDGEFIDFDCVVSGRHVGDRLGVEVMRDGQRLEVEVQLKAPVYFVDEDRFDVKPSYFVWGGLLFAPLTRNYLKTWGDSWWQTAPRELVTLYESGVPTEDWQEPVVLQKVLPDAANQGFHDCESLLIRSALGVPIRNLRHLVALVESTEERYVVFESFDGKRIVLDRRQALDRGATILRKFGVPNDRSPDLLKAPSLVYSHAAS